MRRARPLLAALALAAPALAALVLSACDPAPQDAAPAGSATGASPNASILPGPRAEEVVPVAADGDGDDDRDAGPRGIAMGSAGPVAPDAGPPSSLRPDRPLPLDPLARAELPGVTLSMELKWRDVPSPPKAAEVNADGIARAVAVTRFGFSADLGEEGRMRISLEGRGFPLPPRTELRARDDRYGHVLLWPERDRYRPIAPGALRALLGERRVDVTPLSPGTIQRDIKAKPPAVEGLPEGAAAREVQIESSLGTLVLVLVTLPEAGRGAIPLCRMLVEIAGVEPSQAVCKAGEVPMVAQLSWKGGGGIDVGARTFARRADLAPGDLAVPPPSASYTVDGLPEVPFGVFLTREDLAIFRTKPVPSPIATDAPGEGFFAHNHTDVLFYLLLDGVPVVAVPPQESRYLIGPLAGSYVAQWRTFLGERVEPARPVTLPARLRIGTPPAAEPSPP